MNPYQLFGRWLYKRSNGKAGIPPELEEFVLVTGYEWPTKKGLFSRKKIITKEGMTQLLSLGIKINHVLGEMKTQIVHSTDYRLDANILSQNLNLLLATPKSLGLPMLRVSSGLFCRYTEPVEDDALKLEYFLDYQMRTRSAVLVMEQQLIEVYLSHFESNGGAHFTPLTRIPHRIEPARAIHVNKKAETIQLIQ